MRLIKDQHSRKFLSLLFLSNHFNFVKFLILFEFWRQNIKMWKSVIFGKRQATGAGSVPHNEYNFEQGSYYGWQNHDRQFPCQGTQHAGARSILNSRSAPKKCRCHFWGQNRLSVELEVSLRSSSRTWCIQHNRFSVIIKVEITRDRCWFWN